MRIVAVLSGGDWFDASVVHLVVRDDVNLVAARAEWRRWYETDYCGPANRDARGFPGHHVKFLTFAEWLCDRNLARLSSDEVEEFWDE